VLEHHVEHCKPNLPEFHKVLKRECC